MNEFHSLHSNKGSTHLASDAEIRFVLKRAFKHPTIVLYEVEVDSSLSSWPVRVLHQSLHIQSDPSTQRAV